MLIYFWTLYSIPLVCVCFHSSVRLFLFLLLDNIIWDQLYFLQRVSLTMWVLLCFLLSLAFGRLLFWRNVVVVAHFFIGWDHRVISLCCITLIDSYMLIQNETNLIVVYDFFKSFFINLFFNFILFQCMSVLSSYMSVLHMCAGLVGVGRGHRMPWN